MADPTGGVATAAVANLVVRAAGDLLSSVGGYPGGRGPEARHLVALAEGGFVKQGKGPEADWVNVQTGQRLPDRNAARQWANAYINRQPLYGTDAANRPPTTTPGPSPADNYRPSISPLYAGVVVALPRGAARARKKLSKRARKALKKARVPPWLTREVLKRAPWLVRVGRYWGPTGAVLAGTDVWRNREAINKQAREWIANNPGSPNPVRRAPGPPPRGPRYPSKGPTTRPFIAPPPIPRGPGTRPVIVSPTQPGGPATSPSSSPWQSPRRSPGASQSVMPWTLPGGLPVFGSSPARAPAPSKRPAPTPAPRTSPAPGPAPRMTLPPWARTIAPFLPLLVSPRAPQRSRIASPYQPPQSQPVQGLTPFQAPGLQLAPQTARCKCPKPKQRKKGESCSNPVVRRRKTQRDGQTFITTTRLQKCPA